MQMGMCVVFPLCARGICGERLLSCETQHVVCVWGGGSVGVLYNPVWAPVALCCTPTYELNLPPIVIQGQWLTLERSQTPLGCAER